MPEPPEPTTDRSRYPAHPRQVASARRRAERVVGGWDAGQETVENVSAVVSELVTNAVIHARTRKGREVGLTLLLLDSAVRVEVRDADPTLLTAPAAPSDHTGVEHLPGNGRGLLLVDQLCEGRWGSVEEVIGKTVWAEVRLIRAAAEDEPAPPDTQSALCQRSGAQ